MMWVIPWIANLRVVSSLVVLLVVNLQIVRVYASLTKWLNDQTAVLCEATLAYSALLVSPIG